METQKGLWAAWSRVNQEWIVLFGDSPCPMDGKTFFHTKSELREHAKALGLAFDSDRKGVVTFKVESKTEIEGSKK